MKIDISLLISIIILIITIANLIFVIIKYKQYRIHGEKILTKRRLFGEWYQLVKDFTDRLEFTEIKKNGGYNAYCFRIRNKDGTDYLEYNSVLRLMERIGIACSRALSVSGIKVETKKVNPIEDYDRVNTVKVLQHGCFTVPNDMLPNDPEELRAEMLNNVIIDAKENGVKKRYLI